MKVCTGIGEELYITRPLALNASDFMRIGNEVKIWPHAKLVNTNNISIGHRSIIDDFCLFIAAGESIQIGAFVHIAAFCSITGRGGAVMENFSGIAAGCRLITSDEDYSRGTCLTNPSIPEEYRIVSSAGIHINKHAIIGTNTVILPGVCIGEGCAVGANSLVTKDLEPWSICIGSPAKPVKMRPREKIMELELELFEKYPQNIWPTNHPD